MKAAKEQTHGRRIAHARTHFITRHHGGDHLFARCATIVPN